MGKKGWFTFLGAAIGAAIGGPWGAAIGGWLGYNLGDESVKINCPYCKSEILIEPKENFYWGCPNCKKGFVFDFFVDNKPIVNFNEYKETIYWIITLFSMGFVAKLDGIIDDLERNKCVELFRGIIDDPSAVLEVFDSDVVRKEDGLDFWNKQLKDRLIFTLKDLPESVFIPKMENFLVFLYEIANASYGIHPKQELFIYDVAATLNIGDSILKEIKARIVNSSSGGYYAGNATVGLELNKAFDVLGVSSDVDCATLKKIYKRKLFELHPDKYQSLPDEVRKVLEEKVKELNNAFSVVSQHKNCK